MTTAAQNQSRDERVKHFLSLGHDQLQAENLADGRPAWSQRIVDNGPDYTKTEIYQTQVRHNEEAAKTRKERPDPDLEVKFDSIQFQLRNWENALDDAEGKIQHLEKRRGLARELLADSKGFTDDMARTDTRRANQILETTELPLKQQKERVENAKTQLKIWRKRLQEFPQEELKKLKREQARRLALQF